MTPRPTIADTLIAIARLEESLKTIVLLVADHEKILNGDGNPGLKTALAVLCHDMKLIRWLLGTAIAALVVNIIGQVFWW